MGRDRDLQETEVDAQVFVRDIEVTVHLESNTVSALRALADARGVADSELIREWVLERIHAT